MLKAAELGRSLSKEHYDEVLPGLRAALLDAQSRLQTAGFSVLVLVNGAGGSGKGQTVNALHEWLDARYLVSEAYSAPTEDQRERPEFWRYWLWLPAAGRVGIFSGSWYRRPIMDHVKGRSTELVLAAETASINAFERTLSDAGTLIVKLWFHISKRDQKRRFKDLESRKETRFRVTKQDWKHHEQYDDFAEVVEQVLSHTSTGYAPWQVVEGVDDRYRDVTAARLVLDALEARLAQPAEPRRVVKQAPIDDPKTVFDRLDLSLTISKSDADLRIASLQSRLNLLCRKLQKKRKSAILVFEGADAAGKGGAIRRVTWALDSRSYRVIPISAPTDEERAHHYLWRFWRQLPRRGRMTIYDRSWYGRVLVERVEGFAKHEEWQRAYQEINDFERELVEGDVIVIKLWLQISQEEQLRRFNERELDPIKRHKITPEDYRNRDKANQYELAAAEMLARCSLPESPFTLVEANDKRFARVKVLETICERLSQEL